MIKPTESFEVSLVLKLGLQQVGEIRFVAREGFAFKPEEVIGAEQAIERALGLRCHINLIPLPDQSLAAKSGHPRAISYEEAVARYPSGTTVQPSCCCQTENGETNVNLFCPLHGVHEEQRESTRSERNEGGDQDVR